MRWVGETLRNREVADELAADVAQQWDQPIDSSTVADFPEDERPRMLDAIWRSEAGYGSQMADIQRARIAEAVSLIQKYVVGEGEATLRNLKGLRNKRLAHQEIEAKAATAP